MSLSNSQYDEIIREYQARQIHNQHVLEARIHEVYSKDARLKEIDNEIASISVLTARRMLEGKDTALYDLHQEISLLKKEKLSHLEKLGYPESYFTPPYGCKDCQDTGYINNKRCHCFKQKAIDLVYTQSNIKNILQEENFSHFSYDYFSDDEINPKSGATSLDSMKSAVTFSRKFIDHFNSSFSNLFIYGDIGVGKTFLSNCIAKELLDSGYSVIYFTAFQLVDIFEKNAFGKDKDSDTIMAHQNIFDCDLLIVDDLGTEKPGSFTNSQLFLCLNERILRKKSTIISSNLGMNQIAEKYSERIFSRITSYYQLIPLFGIDIRLQKKLRQ